MKERTRIAFTMLALTSCNANPPTGTNGDASVRIQPSVGPDAEFFQTPEQRRRRSLSLISLIANPEKYRNADVSVSGFFKRDEEPPHGNLYLDRDSARMGMLPNSVHITLGRCRLAATARDIMDPARADELEEGYALVQGVFEPTERAGFQVGTICGVVGIGHLQDVNGIADGGKPSK